MAVIATTSDPWSPVVHGPPVDGVCVVEQLQLQPWAGVVGLLSRPGEDETFWNGTAFVAYADLMLAGQTEATSNGQALAAQNPGLIVGTMPHYRRWQLVMPWSRTGPGRFAVRTFANMGYGFNLKGLGDRREVTVTGPASANPDSVPPIDSDTGGVDALRITDRQGNGIAGVAVHAMYVPAGTNTVYLRGLATTDEAGRWTLDRRCQPNTTHLLNFQGPGFREKQVAITTGAAI